MANRLHNTQIKECLKHYKYMDFIRHEQLFLYVYTKLQWVIIYSDIVR